MYTRELEIIDLMGDGFGIGHIKETLAKKYQVHERSIERQYYQIVNKMEADLEASRAELRSKLMTRNDNIYQKALRSGAYKTALDANAAMAKLAGLGEKAEPSVKKPEFIVIKERDYNGPALVKNGTDDENTD